VQGCTRPIWEHVLDSFYPQTYMHVLLLLLLLSHSQWSQLRFLSSKSRCGSQPVAGVPEW
jgi:hypothetical protein